MTLPASSRSLGIFSTLLQHLAKPLCVSKPTTAHSKARLFVSSVSSCSVFCARGITAFLRTARTHRPGSLTCTPKSTTNSSLDEPTDIMADSINMNGLSLNDSQHAPPPGQQQNGFAERSAYIPPHLRGRGGPPPSAGPGFDGGPPPPVANGMNGSANGFPPPGGYV